MFFQAHISSFVSAQEPRLLTNFEKIKYKKHKTATYLYHNLVGSPVVI